MQKSVIIIGAGIGGLAAGAKMIKKGYDVKIIEKNSCCGGKTGMIKEDGFTFNLTASIMMMPDEYLKLARELGLDLDFIKLEPNYRLNYFDGTVTDFYSDAAKTLEEIERINQRDGQGYLQFLADGYKKYQIAYQCFLNRNFDSLDDLLNNATLRGLLMGNPLTNSYRYISKFIKDDRIRDFLAFQTMYIGVDPFKSSNLYTLIPVISAIKGLWYLKGGLYSLVSALETYIRANGGIIELETTCREFIIEDSSLKGIITDKGSLNGDIIICSSDYAYSLKTFFNDEPQDKKIDVKDEDRDFAYSCSVFMLYLGLKKKYDSLAVHNIYIGENFKKNIEAAFLGKLPQEPSLYIYCPSKIDDSMAPPGKDAINVMLRVPNTKESKIRWNNEQIMKMRELLLQTLAKIKGLEDINANIQYENYLTPRDFEERFNSSYGNAFGISHNLPQTAFLRPQIKSPDFDNFYFVGDSVHPGAGVSLVLIGSNLLCEYL